MATYLAHVTQVIDGDTFWVRTNTGQHKIRLDNIDTAEQGEPGASAATNYLRRLIEGQQVEIQERGMSGDRIRAHVWRTSDNQPINQAMVNQGHSEWINYP